MKKIVLGVVLIIGGLTACSDNKQHTLSQSDIQAKVDSIVGSRMADLNKQSVEDLENRMAIDVKAKADSIIAARTNPDTNKVKKSEQVKVKIEKPVIKK